MTRPTAEEIRAKAIAYVGFYNSKRIEDEIGRHSYEVGFKEALDLGMHWEEVTPENPVPVGEEIMIFDLGGGLNVTEISEEDVRFGKMWLAEQYKVRISEITHFLRIKLPVKREVGE